MAPKFSGTAAEGTSGAMAQTGKSSYRVVRLLGVTDGPVVIGGEAGQRDRVPRPRVLWAIARSAEGAA